jgi:hypothetical protein
MATIRWNIAVSEETDQSLRLFLAEQKVAYKGSLSRFVEEAVRAQLFERAAVAAKSATAHLSETEVADLISEAIQWSKTTSCE